MENIIIKKRDENTIYEIAELLRNEKLIEDLHEYLHDIANDVLVRNELRSHEEIEIELTEHEQKIVADHHNLSDAQIAELFFVINDIFNEHWCDDDEISKVTHASLTLIHALFARLGYLK
ncbi:hypothetical protein [Enterococcus faecalis]|jgi:hypothetical protein|uniref:hypothetical protein n=1 Tax=Enterococcus faecalis TaxID=1351 RepID=UPI0021CA6089|nr:hypothetical protein [Enterococcus faecalis]